MTTAAGCPKHNMNILAMRNHPKYDHSVIRLMFREITSHVLFNGCLEIVTVMTSPADEAAPLPQEEAKCSDILDVGTEVITSVVTGEENRGVPLRVDIAIQTTKPKRKKKHNKQQTKEPQQAPETASPEVTVDIPAPAYYEDDDEDIYHIQADFSTKEGEISVDNYDMYNQSTKFTDHGTIAALEKLGIDPGELLMPTNAEIAEYDHDTDFRSVFVTHHEDRISRLKKLVSRERRVILDIEANRGVKESARIVTQRSTNADSGGAIEMERRQVEKLKARQKREIEGMINNVFRLERLQQDMAEVERKELERRKQEEEERKQRSEEAHERHMQKLKELEELEKQKKKQEEEKRREQYERDQKALALQQKLAEERLEQMKEAERIRLEKAEKNRQQLKEIEENRKAKIREAEMKMQEKETRRLQKVQEENERLAREHQELAEKRQKQIKAAQEYERTMQEKKRKDAEERDKAYEEKIKEMVIRKKEDAEAFAKQNEERIKRNATMREKLRKQQEDEKKAKCMTNEDLQKRLARIEQMKEERATAARLSQSDGAVKLKTRTELYQKKMEKRQKDIEAQAKRSHEKLQKAKEEKNKQAMLKQLQYKLKQEEQQKNQVHLARQKQRKDKETVKKMEEEMERMKKFEAERLMITRERTMRVQQLTNQRMEIQDEINRFSVTNRLDMKTIQRLAQQYDIDFQGIKAKYQRPKTEMESGQARLLKIANTM